MGLGQELAVVVAVGMEGTMLQGLLNGAPVVEELAGGWAEIMGDQLLPDVFDGLRRGVQHVVVVETIVAQLVEDDFVGREVGDGGWVMDVG